MKTVDMEEVDRTVLETGQCLVEGGAHEARKPAKTRIVKGGEIAIDVLRIESAVLVAGPPVDRKAAGRQVQGFHRLTKGGIGYAALGSQLGDRMRPQNVHEPETEWHVLDPARRRQPFRQPQQAGPKQG